MTDKQITTAAARIMKTADRDHIKKVFKLDNDNYVVLDGYRALYMRNVPADMAAAAVPAAKEWPGLNKLFAGFVEQQAKATPVAAPDRKIAAALLKEDKKAVCRVDGGASPVAVKAQYIRDMCDALPGAYWFVTSPVSPLFAVDGANFGIVLPMRVMCDGLTSVNAPAAEQPAAQPEEIPAPVEEAAPAQDTAPAPVATADPIAAALALPARHRRVDRLHAAEKAAPVEEKPAMPATPTDIKPGARNDSFAGTAITGKGYTITFDKQEARTLIKFDKKPAAAVLALLKQEGFFWSPARSAWVKGLNMKAYRAALRVNAALAA